MKQTKLMLVALLAALVLNVMLFTACGNSQSPSSTAESTDNLPTVSTSAGNASPASTSVPVTSVPVTSAPVTTVPVTTSPVTTSYTGPLAENPVSSYEIIKGDATKLGKTFKTSETNTRISLETLWASAEFSVAITPGGTGQAGVIFGYSKDGDTESYYRFTVDENNVYLLKFTGTKSQTLFSNFGSNVGTTKHAMKIIVTADKVYCYSRDRLFAVVEDNVIGKKVGYFAVNKGTSFSSPKFDYAVNTPDQIDTILFGHSYFNGWYNWEADTKALFEEFGLGSGRNLGIGGSGSHDWKKLKETLTVYKPKMGIYMIGINDMVFGRSPELTVSDIEETILHIKKEIPEFELVLISVNHCPAKSDLAKGIIETNKLMRELCAKYDWVHLADIEYDFYDENNRPIMSYFSSDGLHMATHSYPEVIVPAIREALKGENQPEGK